MRPPMRALYPITAAVIHVKRGASRVVNKEFRDEIERLIAVLDERVAAGD